MVGAGGQGAGSEGSRSPGRPPRFQLLESKLHAPRPGEGTVPRTALVERLLAVPVARLVCVAAPSGYGKTTLLAQWAERRSARRAWVTLDRHDNDPVILLRYLAVALDRVGPIDPELLRFLESPGAAIPASLISRFVAGLSSLRHPVTVVLDNLELLTNQECLDAVAEVTLRLPSGSWLGLASRARPSLPSALTQAAGQMIEVGPQDLAMDEEEVRALLERAGVRLSDAEVAELLERTEGWPVGVYLASSAVAGEGRHATARTAASGNGQAAAGPAPAGLLGRLSPATLAFLTRTAVLEELSGPLCDAVLEMGGSERVLESLAGSKLLVLEVEHRDRWYRYHQLLREMLLAELERREPELIPQLHARAATWYEANGLPEAAIDHAQAAGDPDQVARLVLEAAPRAYASGRRDTATWWYDWFEDQRLIERYPLIAVQGAWRHALLGQPAGTERWTAAAERASASARPPERRVVEASLAVLHAALCRAGIERMRADARFARERIEPGDSSRGPALHLEATSYLLAGESDRADTILIQAVEVATQDREMNAVSYALAQRSLIAIQRHDWDRAETLAQQALTVVRDGGLDDYVTSPLVYAVAARTALHRGDVPGAKTHLARAAPLRPLLTSSLPTYAVQALLELARAYLTLNDIAGASAALRQAGDVLRIRPDLGTLPAQVEELRSRLDSVPAAVPGSSSLTTAELRLLPLLATHLSFTEIGQRLFLSKHTVKTQAISIYRKLGASSRSQAVQRVQEVGLLGS